jgi:hypothetical protein
MAKSRSNTIVAPSTFQNIASSSLSSRKRRRRSLSQSGLHLAIPNDDHDDDEKLHQQQHYQHKRSSSPQQDNVTTSEGVGGGGSTHSEFQSSSNNNSSINQEPNDDNAATIMDESNKRIRLAKAQAEIDRILNNPVDPPFDFETEMTKVVSISPPLIPEGSSEYKLEEQVSQMEEDLYSAVKAQDFTTASQRQGEISQLHVDDCGLVLQVNSAFYKAFSNKDIADMERIWLKDRSCICIHPSFKPLSGVRDIMHTWKRMFESSVGSFQRTWIDPCDIQLTVKATTAVVTCEEQVYARRFVRGKKRESEMVNKLMATNIFRKVGGKWYMTYHHSSWHADSEAAQMALKRGNASNNSGGVIKTSKRTSVGPGGDSTVSSRRKRREEDDSGPTGLESILGVGNVGPLLGDDSEGTDSGNSGKKIITGSLSEYLMNQFGNKDGIFGNGDNNDNGIGSPGAIIHFSRIESDGDDDEDEDEDGETYEIFDDEGENDGDDESYSSLQSWVQRTRAQRRNRMSRRQQDRSEKPLRQECIDALRKLASEGRISPKQKRVLLTDIISCSSKGENSMVEVAYELLCGEGKDPEEAEEEFVDQCRVFAQSFSEPQY